ncbi:MAG: CBS domain-containing protein [Deltaproteobacteria bacterium]|nr:CBS domain-containing protein [Deltaproteobacteria bacterium]
MLKSKLVIRDTDTLEAAMVAIENNNYRSVIVVNQNDVVVGTLSDGDARKSVLDHRLLSTPVHRVMNPNFIALTVTEREKAARIFNETHVFLIPLIDEHGQLVDVLTAYPPPPPVR